MKGIQYLLNDEGVKTGVLIDLKMYNDIWEDFYDTVLAKKRKNEPRDSIESVREMLISKGKLNV